MRVVGFHGRTPLLEFLGKGHHFANLTGEKLSEYQVTRAVAEVTRRRGLALPVYVLAPCWDERQPYYGVFVERRAWDEADAGSALAEIDAALAQGNDEYRGKRTSGRLGPVRMMWLPPGTWAKWDGERLARSGGPPEQYKHPCLIGDVKFKETMPVERSR